MSIILISEPSFPVAEVSRCLKNENVEVLVAKLGAHFPGGSIFGVSKVFVIAPEQAIIHIGEITTRVRRMIGTGIRLILCVTGPIISDEKLLLECGADQIVCPRSWSAIHVAERLLGELIRDGDIQPMSSGSLFGATLAVRNIYFHIEKLAPLSEQILVLGETGTGKELIAKELHRQSKRPGPFLAVNCPELNPELAASEPVWPRERSVYRRKAITYRAVYGGGKGDDFSR